ncbi:MAG: M48 family metalloprotease [bacterium]|nr:M48 family metalloprotease [bacterium]
MTRRDFLWLASLSTAGVVTGCAMNPVTGQRQLMLMSEGQEIQLDQENSPHQFSADYGSLQDRSLNAYIAQVGNEMAAQSHRPQMPYSFQGVNATYVNAYAFPGGSIATTRGILLELENEAELAGLLGHEIGHVNARHTAERMSKNILIGGLVAVGTAYVQSEHEKWAPLAAGLGGIAAGALLARYSRDDERQADALGMEYMTHAGHNPTGMVGLMDVLRNMSKHKPNAIEMMFATHPMSEERYQTAKRSTETTYHDAQNMPLNKERYMDHTAGLRKLKGAIETMQAGEKEMAKQQFPRAEKHFESALQQAPRDYAGLVMMAKCQLAQDNHRMARQYAERAKQVNPTEAQAHHISGIAKFRQNDFNGAYADFSSYENMLPGNPNTVFFKGVSLEGMQRKQTPTKPPYPTDKTILSPLSSTIVSPIQTR